MRITIGHKIFGIAGLVIALMLGAAVLTNWKVSQVTDQVDALALHFLPMTNRMGEVQSLLLQQEVLLQRITNDIAVGSLSPEVDEHLARFEALGAVADAEIETAVQIANQAILAAPHEEARLELARLGSRIEDVERQHHDIQDLVVRAVRAHQEGRIEAAETLVQSFEQAQAQFDETVSSVVAQIVTFSEMAALQADREERVVLRFSILVTALAVATGLLFSAQLTRSLVRPVRRLRDRTREVETGDLSEDIAVTTSDEIGDLTRSFNNMLEGLRARERVKSMFSAYVDPRVVETILEGEEGDGLSLLGDKKQVTVFFSDIVGFTQIGERLSPVGLVRLMNEYLSLASKPIVGSDGVIDKYIGDMVMAFWCAPFVPEGDQARLACEAALAQFEQLKTLEQRLPDVTGLRKDLPDVDIRVGLASGNALVGSIGSEYTKNFTVMGDTVNMASRLEGANKVYGTRILICENTMRQAEDAIEVREIDFITLQGKTEPLRVFELLAMAGGLSDSQIEARRDFAAGLAAYRAQDWSNAERAFASCLETLPGDRPCQLFLDRLTHLRASPPAEDWDGVWHVSTK